MIFFLIHIAELKKAVRFFEPFVKFPKFMDDSSEDYDEDKAEEHIPKNEELLLFELDGNSSTISVNNGNTRIEKQAKCICNDKVSFCISWLELRNLVDSIEADAGNEMMLVFREIPFRGFDVSFENNQGRYGIRAYSTYDYPTFPEMAGAAVSFELPKEKMVESYSILHKYCRFNRLDPLRKYVHFEINEDSISAYATSGEVFSAIKFSPLHVESESCHFVFDASCANGIIPLLNNEPEMFCTITDNMTMVPLPNNDAVLYFSKNGETVINCKFVMRKNEPTRKIVINKEKLEMFLERSRILCPYQKSVYLHSLNGYLHCHTYESRTESAYEWLQAKSSDDDYKCVADIKNLKILLSDVTTKEVELAISENNSCYVLAPQETYDGDSMRLMILSQFDSRAEEIFSEDYEKAKELISAPDISCISYVLGEPFPLEKYVIAYDEYCVPIITPTSFDVVVSLFDIAIDEEMTFAKKEIEVRLLKRDAVPFVFFNFNDLLCQGIAINIMKLGEKQRQEWLNSTDDDCCNLFLIDAATSNLVAIRRFQLKLLKEIKKECKLQEGFTSNEIDSAIRYAKREYPMMEMFANANYREIIEEPEL